VAKADGIYGIDGMARWYTPLIQKVELEEAQGRATEMAKEITLRSVALQGSRKQAGTPQRRWLRKDILDVYKALATADKQKSCLQILQHRHGGNWKKLVKYWFTIQAVVNSCCWQLREAGAVRQYHEVDKGVRWPVDPWLDTRRSRPGHTPEHPYHSSTRYSREQEQRAIGGGKALCSLLFASPGTAAQ